MATEIEWPGTLPQNIEQNGYKEGNIDNLINSPMNMGPYKSRRRSTEAYQPLSASMVMSTAQRDEFYTFYKTEIYSGALSFLFPKPGVVGSTIETKITTFSFAPISGSQWRITLSLVVLVE